ncbi:maleylpyruvate isomerase family mycothiol-dependent enzyme [Spiractinospora alimapuensis]|uniref:maleylpyruvate isomerase family mycothiol-dependent enzyme n=1 Tax=Spiractinospora alimapuensis TaxID=2820884 RepID=UPI001F299C6D|nr:maleylpyruvate isomerase family mycothiol-dependent enzyme [Spiractinospora alimapuensis]QVQ52182.1 maleylpyruvate isomerase family mycothiol-dependent enzyme [Spiractinospora alimapuensis]
MDTESHLEHLRRAGDVLGSSAVRAGLDADVPTCPGWRVRDLIHHVGEVHRWAAANVAAVDAHQVPRAEALARDPVPHDDALVDWFADGLDALHRVLVAAPAGKPCWTFTPTADPLAFWARRQAHETVIHSVDADRAARAVTHDALTPELASDGVDELLTVLLPRLVARRGGDPSALSARERSLAVHTHDTNGRWFLHASPTAFTVSAGTDAEDGNAQCGVTGDAETVYLALWNRSDSPELMVSGDLSVMEWWRDSVHF